MVIPLVMRIEIGADDIQVMLLPAQAGPFTASEQIPRLKLRQPIGFGRFDIVAAPGAGDHMDQRIALDEPSMGRPFANRFDRSDARPHQLMLEFLRAPACVRVEVRDFAPRPTPERHLVDRRVERHADALVHHHLRCSSGETGEALDECRAPEIQVIRITVMAQIPNHLHLLRLRRFEHRHEAAPVVAARAAFDQVPAQAVAGTTNVQPAQSLVILVRPARVSGVGQQVQAPTILAALTGTFETGHDEAAEDRMSACAGLGFVAFRLRGHEASISVAAVVGAFAA